MWFFTLVYAVVMFIGVGMAIYDYVGGGDQWGWYVAQAVIAFVVGGHAVITLPALYLPCFRKSQAKDLSE